MLFLLLLLGVKMSAYHPLTHDEAEEPVSCEFCVLVFQHELQDFDYATTFSLEHSDFVPLFFEEHIGDITTPIQKYTGTSLFSRPPPQWA